MPHIAPAVRGLRARPGDRRAAALGRAPAHPAPAAARPRNPRLPAGRAGEPRRPPARGVGRRHLRRLRARPELLHRAGEARCWATAPARRGSWRRCRAWGIASSLPSSVSRRVERVDTVESSAPGAAVAADEPRPSLDPRLPRAPPGRWASWRLVLLVGLGLSLRSGGSGAVSASAPGPQPFRAGRLREGSLPHAARPGGMGRGRAMARARRRARIRPSPPPRARWPARTSSSRKPGCGRDARCSRWPNRRPRPPCASAATPPSLTYGWPSRGSTGIGTGTAPSASCVTPSLSPPASRCPDAPMRASCPRAATMPAPWPRSRRRGVRIHSAPSSPARPRAFITARGDTRRRPRCGDRAWSCATTREATRGCSTCTFRKATSALRPRRLSA